MSRLSVALAGIGGYGIHYLAPLLDAADQSAYQLVAAIDPAPQACKRLADLQKRGLAIYPSLDAFQNARFADLLIICTPLHLHASQTCAALAHGSNILCEKPLCATPDQGREMLDARDREKKHVAIGYQWSYSPAIQQLKADVLSGFLGKALRLKSLVLWPRDESYYRRNAWAGALKDSRGDWVLDSPVNNAAAHYLHNMLYVLGERTDRSATPARVSAELYRANAIENYDTAAMRCFTRDGVQILFIVSHATQEMIGPIFHYEFERAVVEFANPRDGPIVARFADGSSKSYGNPNDSRDRKLWMTIEAIRGGTEPLCGIEAAAAHTRCVWAAQQSTPDIAVFPQSQMRISGPPGKRLTSVDGLGETLRNCYEQWMLPGEPGTSWSRPAKEITIRDDA
jgi:predicted dehydrogenase